MYSLDLDRLVSFPRFGGTNLSPAWSADGTKLAFSSSRSGDPEIYTVDASGSNLKRITSFKGPDVSPAWNRKTGAQMTWVSGRTGLPQVYTMEFLAKHLHNLAMQIRIGEMNTGYDDGHNQDSYQQYHDQHGLG